MIFFGGKCKGKLLRKKNLGKNFSIQNDNTNHVVGENKKKGQSLFSMPMVTSDTYIIQKKKQTKPIEIKLDKNKLLPC